MLSRATLEKIRAALVLIGAIAAWILVEPEVLMPIAGIALAVAVGGVFAIRAHVRRLPAQPYNEVRVLLLEAGTGLTIVGLVAFLILLLEFSS